MLCSKSPLWFAVHVMPQHEYKVAAQLRFKGQEEFLPSVSLRRKWSDRSKVISRPMFPGYVFCRMDRSSFGTVLSTPGVYRIVSFGGQAYPVSEDEMKSIHQILNSGRDAEPIPYLKAREEVQVLNGPLKSLRGTITQHRAQSRLVISVETLMQSVAVEVNSEELCELAVSAHLLKLRTSGAA